MRDARRVPGPLLGLAPVRFLGRISYSLYLWHWPLHRPADRDGRREPLPLASASASCSRRSRSPYASQRWLEDPIRRGRLVGIVPRRNLGSPARCSIAVATASLGLGFGTTQRLAAASGRRRPGHGRRGPPRPRRASPGRHGAVEHGPDRCRACHRHLVGPSRRTSSRRWRAARDDMPADLRRRLPPPQPATELAECVFGDPHRRRPSSCSATRTRPSGSRPRAPGDRAVVAVGVPDQERLHAGDDAGLERQPQARVHGVRPVARCRRDPGGRGATRARHRREQPSLPGRGQRRAATRRRRPDARRRPGHDPRPAPIVGRGRRPDRRHAEVRLRPAGMPVRPPRRHARLQPAAGRDARRGLARDRTRASRQRTARRWSIRTGWACPTDPCPSVIGRFLVYRDQHHLATPYVVALRDRLAGALPAVAAGPR